MATASLCHVSISAALSHDASRPKMSTWHAQATPFVSSSASMRTSHVRSCTVRALAKGGSEPVNVDFGGSEPPGNSGGSGGGGGGQGGGGGGDEGSGEGSSLWEKYLWLLQTAPVRTKSITSMALNALGDLLCQLGVEERSSVDGRRLGIAALLGLLLVGPTLHFWYSSLGKIVSVGGNSGAVMQLFLDQFVFSPSFICVFFSALFTLEGRPQDIVPKLKQDWGTTVVTNWKIWIPFQFLNFRLVPPPLRVAVANVIALAWNVYLSFASHTKVKKLSQ